MLSDIKRELSASLGILDMKEGVSQRAVFYYRSGGHHPFLFMLQTSVSDEVLKRF